MAADVELIQHQWMEPEIMKVIGFDPNSAKDRVALLLAQKYELDLLAKELVLIQGRPYITRDGLLAVAHRSGVFDGITVDSEGEDGSHWFAIVSVYRKDMTHPFRYRGRYPLNGDNKKYGPEMAVKCAEVMALRRAFHVTGIATVEEAWDKTEPQPEVETDGELLIEKTSPIGAALSDRAAALPAQQKSELIARFKGARLAWPLTEQQVEMYAGWLDDLEDEHGGPAAA